MKLLKYTLIFLMFLLNIPGKAQKVIEIPPIFEYPVAPEELESLKDRCNYIVANFWTPLNEKNNEPLNQIALNDAFNVFLTSMIYADETTSIKAIDKLLDRISGNPTLLIQFTKAAEDNLYGPRSEIRSDDVYLKFLDAAIKNKKISKDRKEKFQQRAALLRSTAINAVPPTFSFTNLSGGDEKYFPMATPTLLIFGDPEDMDWRLERLKMESNITLNQLLEKGKINIIFIDITDRNDWENSVSNYSKNWKVGKVKNIKDIYDIRRVPTLYLVNNEGKIIMKNQPLSTTLETAMEIAGN